MMRRRRGFNLSDWALHHRSLVWFLMIVSMVAGLAPELAAGLTRRIGADKVTAKVAEGQRDKR